MLSASSLVTGLEDSVCVPYRFRKIHVRTPEGPLWIPYGHGNIRPFSFAGTVRSRAGLGIPVRSMVQGLTWSGEARECTLALHLPSQTRVCDI